MKFTGTVDNAPRNEEDFRHESQIKREYRKAQKGMRNLRQGKRDRWAEKEKPNG